MWFKPAARLAKQQVVCGASCRLRRRRKQARARRAKEPEWHRREERERKRRSREEQRQARLRAAAEGDCAREEGSSGVCHAPGDMAKRRESQREFARLWDTLLEVSRAGWEREVRKIARGVWKKLRQEPAAGGVCHAPGGFSIP